MNKPFRILSIDGGGIRGIFPAKILANMEDDLAAGGASNSRLYEHFDLICGTSTGGIIALAIALGIPAREILNLYLDHANEIFGKKRSFFARIRNSAYDRTPLETIIRETFKYGGRTEDPRLIDCKTSVCIPVYDLMRGSPSILKTKHHPSYVRDYHLPAYQVALATSAAPTYFDPYSGSYIDLNGAEQFFNNKVDGGVVVNNPTHVGIIEAQKAFGKPLDELSVLSIGTGTKTFCDSKKRSKWGLLYWVNRRKRIIEVFTQGQSQQTQNMISLMQKGIDKREGENFVYHRIDTSLDDTCDIALDETRRDRLEILVEKAHYEYQRNATILRDRFSGLRS